MQRQRHSRLEWLSTLSTRELVIYLMELQRVEEQQPELGGEVDDACTVLRRALFLRECPLPVSR
jgi:hypothetical protein